MKLLIVLAFVATFCHLTALADEQEEAVQLEGDVDEEENDAELEAELGEVGISEQVIHLPTLPQEIEGGPAWECTPRMIYRNTCQVCRCSRNRRLKCVRRNCNPL